MNIEDLVKDSGCSTIEEYIENQEIRKHISQLMAKAVDGASLSSMVNEIAQLLSAPVSVLDNSLSFVAMSDSFTEAFFPLCEEYQAGYLPDDALERLKTMKLVDFENRKLDTTVFQWHMPDGSLHTNHHTLIYMNKIYIGSFSVFTGESPLPGHYLQLMPIFANILSVIMQRSDFYQTNKSTYYNHLLAHILDNTEVVDSQTYELRLSLFGYSVKKHKQIIFVDLSGENYSIAQQHTLAQSLQKHIRNSIYVLLNDNLVFLSSNDKPEPFEIEEIEACRRLIGKSGLKVGISDIFENITKTRTYLIQAEKAIETGSRIHPEDRVFTFDDYRIDDLITKVEDHKVIFSYLYPPLMRLIRHDQAHNTSLAYTLLVFLEDPNTPARACERLSIHKNTLYYRLGKIRDIMQVDFRSAEIIMRIQLSFHILKFQKKFDSLVLGDGLEEAGAL